MKALCCAAPIDSKPRAPERLRSLLSELKVCSSSRDLERGRVLHEAAVEYGDDSNIFVASALVNMYAKCGSMERSRSIFDSIEDPDVVAWNALVLGYAENRQSVVALALFSRMRKEGCAAHARTFVAALKACVHLAIKEETMERGMKLHLLVLIAGCDSDIYVSGTLVDMYVKCGSMQDAHRVFDCMKHDVVAWTSIILGYADTGDGALALNLFLQMKLEGCLPSTHTFVAALKACSVLADTEENLKCTQRGRALHLLASSYGCDLNVYVENTLVVMYAKCGSMEDARRVFRNLKNPHVVSWTALMLGYAENGECLVTLDLFSRMRSRGCSPDAQAFVAALKACTELTVKLEGVINPSANVATREKGKAIHLLATSSGCDTGLYVLNSLVDMYSKCGSMPDARRVFETVRNPDVVCWNAVILGYAENGDGVTALDLYLRMKQQGCVANARTFVAVLKACSFLGALESGREAHVEICSQRLEHDPFVASSLVDFYAKCGSLHEAEQVFMLSTKTLITWTALIAGYSRRGDTGAVFALLARLQDAGLEPNVITFTCILTACSHAGLVEDGKRYFELMSSKYGIKPGLEHCNCLVDILGRANKLDDALLLLRSMSFAPNVVSWMTVLGACRKWKNVELGSLAFESLVSLDDKYTGAYVSMANLTNAAG